ncbi:MAG: DUF3466 family protein [Pirellulales bacterium]|nr:DUF3466 family protein [Pirellulales bacterium]
MSCRSAILLGVVCFTCSAACFAAPAPRYEVVDLGTLDGWPAGACDINAGGQVAGYYYSSRQERAFLYDGGVMRDIGDLSGIRLTAEARAISDAGHVVGDMRPYEGHRYPFLYHNGTLTDLTDSFGDDRPEGVAHDVNNAGHVVGYLDFPNETAHAFVYHDGTWTDLGTPGHSSEAFAVNEAGQIVGSADLPTGSHAFLYDAGTMIDLGTLPDYTYASRAYDINDLGQVAGYSYAGQQQGHAFLYDHGTMTDLGTFGEYQTVVARSINNHGQIVGTGFKIDYPTSRHAFLWDSGTIIDLNMLIDTSDGMTFKNAWGINDAGWIVGIGGVGQAEHAIMLRPVPEPSAALSLTLFGLILLACRVRWRPIR